MMRHISRRLAFLSLFVSFAFASIAAESEGIFADFTTSMGSFTCRLDYARAPKAVANFVGLATGERAWLDLTNGVPRAQPFYDGLLFHRVITNFMIQGGSPGGLGTDGPGYSFVDEFDPAVRHDGFGVLSMANSGPDSNGSQFFITVGATPWLNDVHTVFGRLVGGSNVVYSISRVATNASNRPLTNVVIHSVRIRRVGSAAQAFNIHAQGLPQVTNANIAIARSGTNLLVTLANRTNVDNRLYSSTNLSTWVGTMLGIATATPFGGVIANPAGNARFFRAAQIEYADPLYVPTHVAGRSLTLNLTGIGVMEIAFNNQGGGTYQLTTPSNGTSNGFVLIYQWIQDPCRGRFKPIFFSLSPMELHLDFDSPTAGTFKGTALPNYPSSLGAFPLSGTFTFAP